MHRRNFVFITGISLGILSGAYMIFLSPFSIGADFQAYYFAVQAFLSGDSIYAAAPPTHPDHHYLYLPATIFWFLPFGLLPEWGYAYILMVIISAAGAVWLSSSIIEVIERQGVSLALLDQVLITAFILFSTFAVPNLLQGQVNLLLGVAIGTGLIAQLNGNSRRAGLLIGLASTMKLFPAVLGIWFLYQRDWLALGIAILTGLAHIALSVAVFGLNITVTFFTEILLGRFRTEGPSGIPPDISMVTIRRPLSVLLGLEGAALSVMALLIGGIITATVLYYSNDELVQLLGLLIATLISFPSYFIYAPILLFPLVPLLYLQEDWLIVGGATLLTATFSLKHISAVLSLFPGRVADPVLTITTPVLSIATPPLIGCVLVLVWISEYIRRQRVKDRQIISG